MSDQNPQFYNTFVDLTLNDTPYEDDHRSRGEVWGDQLSAAIDFHENVMRGAASDTDVMEIGTFAATQDHAYETDTARDAPETQSASNQITSAEVERWITGLRSYGELLSYTKTCDNDPGKRHTHCYLAEPLTNQSESDGEPALPTGVRLWVTSTDGRTASDKMIYWFGTEKARAKVPATMDGSAAREFAETLKWSEAGTVRFTETPRVHPDPDSQPKHTKPRSQMFQASQLLDPYYCERCSRANGIQVQPKKATLMRREPRGQIQVYEYERKTSPKSFNFKSRKLVESGPGETASRFEGLE